jgi:uncharacterized protein YqgV (UPF0045/DUF77 family)
VHRIEFTVEPFVEGQPGPHVTAAVSAAQALGVEFEFGPFGSGCSATAAQSPDVIAAIVRAAFDNGATHVNVDVSQGDDA